MRQVRKIKVLGYPFAGGQGKSGVEMTPSWLQNQAWFKNLANSSTKVPIEYEEVAVSNGSSNLQQSRLDYLTVQKSGTLVNSSDEETIEPKNILNVISSSMNLRKQTLQALKDGYYPIVLGGDHSQAIGSIAGMKRFQPDTKIIWIDAHIDANTPEQSPSGNVHGMPLAYLSGLVPYYENWKCVDIAKDLCYFGIRSYEEDEAQLIQDQNVLVFEPNVCQTDRVPEITRRIGQYFSSNSINASRNYWISFDIDSVDSGQFKSTGTAEGNGLSLDFVSNLFQRITPMSIGMDLTEVNFDLTSGLARQTDEQTFRELFEFICHQVNQPVITEEFRHVHQWKSYSM